MSWGALSDTFANHPVVLKPLELPEADERIVNEVAGAVLRCMAQVAALEGDYVVPMGMWRQTAGFARAEELARVAVFSGYMIRVETDEGLPAFRLVENRDLFNMIPRTARDWANQRRRDARNMDLVIPVRTRDGDACRWCSNVVIFGDQKSGRGGTYDHLQPGKQATVETFIVSCRSCNSARQDDLESWNKPLLPAPTQPYYRDTTVTLLAKHGVAVTSSEKPSPRPAPSGQTNGAQAAAHSATTPAPAVQTPEQKPAQAPEPGPSKDAPSAAESSPGESRPKTAVTDSVMQGREGSGQGLGQEGPGKAGSRDTPPPEESQHENPPTDRPRPDDHRPSKRKRPRRRKRK